MRILTPFLLCLRDFASTFALRIVLRVDRTEQQQLNSKQLNRASFPRQHSLRIESARRPLRLLRRCPQPLSFPPPVLATRQRSFPRTTRPPNSLSRNRKWTSWNTGKTSTHSLNRSGRARGSQSTLSTTVSLLHSALAFLPWLIAILNLSASVHTGPPFATGEFQPVPSRIRFPSFVAIPRLQMR